MDILAANRLATALSPLLAPGRNAILDAFTESEARELHRDWDEMTARIVPYLRSVAGLTSTNPRLVELVGGLSLRSERFRTLWARQDVRHKSSGASVLRHPQVGELETELREAAHPRRRRADPRHLPRPAGQRVPRKGFACSPALASRTVPRPAQFPPRSARPDVSAPDR